MGGSGGERTDITMDHLEDVMQVREPTRHITEDAQSLSAAERHAAVHWLASRITQVIFEAAPLHEAKDDACNRPVVGKGQDWHKI